MAKQVLLTEKSWKSVKQIGVTGKGLSGNLKKLETSQKKAKSADTAEAWSGVEKALSSVAGEINKNLGKLDKKKYKDTHLALSAMYKLAVEEGQRAAQNRVTAHAKTVYKEMSLLYLKQMQVYNKVISGAAKDRSISNKLVLQGEKIKDSPDDARKKILKKIEIELKKLVEKYTCKPGGKLDIAADISALSLRMKSLDRMKAAANKERSIAADVLKKLTAMEKERKQTLAYVLDMKEMFDEASWNII